MSIRSLQTVQQLRLESSADAEAKGRDAFKDAIATHQQNAQRSYDESLRQVDAQRGARETMSNWTLLGTIFGGLAIGSGIGMGFGELANDGDENAANDAQLEVGRADELTKQARDAFESAREDLGDLERTTRAGDGLGRDLREQGWNGIA